MVTNVRVRLILYLVLTSCSVYVRSQSYSTIDDGRTLFQAYVDGRPEQRQFITYLRNRFFGVKEEIKTTPIPDPPTKIKYLPIYVPVPVYSNSHEHSGNDFYGAHHGNGHKDQYGNTIRPQVPQRPSLPYPYAPNYDLPYGGQLLQMLKKQSFSSAGAAYGEHLTKPSRTEYYNSYYDQYPDDDDDYDSVVIDNPEIITDPDLNPYENNVYVRKRRKYRKRKQ